MNVQELSVLAHGGQIEALDLVSLEGGIYVLEAQMDGRKLPVLQGDGHALRLRSVEHAREVLQGIPVEVPLHLVHAVVHDEMIGLPGKAAEPLRVPVHNQPSW
ncbi:DUF6482 family protein [Atopomonas sediminilitoris]|uniref:DUF6482 family protein n=1 Tax=Atopomonas sediminilitoris TaxID=2919919 RepID=UPI001F4EB24A|nr:DUF6482 family protein [Atopomonas sediminilitoris]MCJ8170633.1 DUF6482 family protein [Atopomonas sediminilitoris]